MDNLCSHSAHRLARARFVMQVPHGPADIGLLVEELVHSEWWVAANKDTVRNLGKKCQIKYWLLHILGIPRHYCQIQ